MGDVTHFLREELAQEQTRARVFGQEALEAQHRLKRWMNDHKLAGRVRELQATRQRLVREVRNVNEALDQAVDERDAAIGQLRRERQFFTAEHRSLELKAQFVAECELNGEHESEMSA